MKDWVDAQDRFARATLSGDSLRQDIVRQLGSLREAPRWTAMPELDGGRYLYGRVDPGAERETIYEFDPATGAERIVLDLGKVDPVAKYWIAAPDGEKIAILVAPNGGDAMTCRVFEARTGKWRRDEISGFQYGFPSWTADSSGFYYTWSPTAVDLAAGKRAAQSKVRFHTLGQEPVRDPVVREATGVEGSFEFPQASPDGKWVQVVRLHANGPRSVYLGDARRDAWHPRWTQLTPSDSAHYSIAFGKSDLFVVTDREAPRGRLFRVDPSRPQTSHWTEILPERRGETLDDVTTIGDFVVAKFLRDAETHYEVRRRDGTLVKELIPPSPGSLTSLSGQVTPAEGSLALSTYTEPYQVYLIHAPSFDFVPFMPSRKTLNGGDYVMEKEFYTSPDGTRAPIFLVRARSTPARSAAPLMLYAYGAFGISTSPHYHGDVRVWLDRGGVYAEAIVRGGGEYGNEWHVAGMGKNRTNVYADFIAASEYLVQQGWTAPDRFVIHGVSAGGLLVTVAETERPELYRAVIADVPITDMIRYPLGHDSGTLWLDEYGSPAKPEEFPILYRYSPYHRVKSGVRYPATLILASDNDKRLDPMHGRKFAAALDDVDPCATVLLRTEREGGHSGASDVSARLRETADMYTFALEAVATASRAAPARAANQVH